MTDESVMLTNDNSIVSIEAIYQYTIRDVKQYHFDIDDPEGTLQIAFEAVIRRNIQNRPLDDALLNKEEIERQVLPDFQALIDTYAMGVKINDVRIQNISVPSRGFRGVRRREQRQERKNQAAGRSGALRQRNPAQGPFHRV